MVIHLAETPLRPAAFLHNQIVWQKAGASSVRASITDAGITVNGEFFFNDRGQVNEFRANDRFCCPRNSKEHQR
ncbi:DUF6544 family protein [Pontibacter flavimaris]|uniref:DUF6544 family protein n=1 Tax=Pontibacter flavimaris TaxID=1797110 RepID=UPI00373FC9C2